MVFVCGLIVNEILYVIDDKFYSTSTGATKRCEKLNEARDDGGWVVLYQDHFKRYEGVSK